MMPINKHYWKFELQRIFGLSLKTFVLKAITKTLGLAAGILLVPLSLTFHSIGYRRVTIFTDRVGHLALEPDCLLKEQALGLIPKKKWIMLAPPHRVANEHLLEYWAPYFIVIRNRFICFMIASISRWGALMRHDIGHYSRVQDKHQESFRIYSTWGRRPPLLTLSAEDLEWRNTAFKQLGLPNNAWFVCVHAREGGYSPVDEKLHTHRNCDIESYIPAIKAIVAKGGWVIRIGDASMKPLPKLTNVIDYAHHPMKSPRLDIILCASCKFMLGSTSGICLVSGIFGIPAAITNMVPTADLWYFPGDISIPKKIWSDDQQRYFTLEESLEYPHGCFRYAGQYTEAGLKLTDNNPEDIAELAIEMMSRLVMKEFASEDILSAATYKANVDDRYPSAYSCASIGAIYFNKYAVLTSKLSKA